MSMEIINVTFPEDVYYHPENLPWDFADPKSDLSCVEKKISMPRETCIYYRRLDYYIFSEESMHETCIKYYKEKRSNGKLKVCAICNVYGYAKIKKTIKRELSKKFDVYVLLWQKEFVEYNLFFNIK